MRLSRLIRLAVAPVAPMWRFPGFRRGVTWSMAPLIVLPARMLLAWPPTNFAEWPSDARHAVSGLIVGLYGIAWAGWCASWTGALEWLPWRRFRAPARWVAWLFSVSAGVAALQHLSAVSLLGGLPPLGIAVILQVVFRSAVAPMLIGLTPWLLIVGVIYLARIPLVRRVFYTGRGASSGFATGEDLRDFLGPLP